jgi:hypothetical protein
MAEKNIQERRSDVRTGVDQTLIPLVSGRVRVGRSVRRWVRNRNAQGIRKRQVGAIRASLIPALDSSADGAKNDGEVKGFWLAPFVQHFVSNRLLFVLCQAGNTLKRWRVFGHESASNEKIGLVAEIVQPGKLLDVLDDFLVGEMGQRVLDSAIPSVTASTQRIWTYLAVALSCRST